MANKNAKTEIAPTTESLYTPKELADVSHVFGTMPECVAAALKGVEAITMECAKDKVNKFLKKEVKG